MTEDEMVGWHHQLDGHEFEEALGDGEGQGSLVHRLTKGWTLLSNFTFLYFTLSTLTYTFSFCHLSS